MSKRYEFETLAARNTPFSSKQFNSKNFQSFGEIDNSKIALETNVLNDLFIREAKNEY